MLRRPAITYNLNGLVGGGGIAGTVTMDGSTGTLGTADIVSWNVMVSDGRSSFHLTAGNSTATVLGKDLSASATQLFFNFGDTGPESYLFFQSPSIGDNGPYACFISNGPDCFHASSIVLDLTTGTDSATNPNVHISATGPQVIGTAVPEPFTLSIFGAGLVGAAALRQRKKANQA